MSLRLLCFILAFLQVISVNYQDRCLYYNEADNTCHVTLDLVLLRYNIDSLQTVSHTAWGQTTCREGEIRYQKMVFPAKKFEDGYDGFDIVFSQERKDVYISGVLQQIIVRATVESATINSVPYDCQIIGDGEIQHFGINIPNSPPCTIYVKCNRIATIE